MVTKCVRKVMLVVMELLILILLSVQVNDLAHISSSPSSSPVPAPYSSELDDHGDLHLCLTLGISHCSHFQNTWPLPDFTYESCIAATFARCFTEILRVTKTHSLEIASKPSASPYWQLRTFFLEQPIMRVVCWNVFISMSRAPMMSFTCIILEFLSYWYF